MTRIIAGFAGSLTLATPDAGTRPTSDRVREAIFSALDARNALDGARVVDLYAGSGALGLEAASRGAVQVTLVEHSPAATNACRTNAALVLGRAPKNSCLAIDVAGKSVQAFLAASADTWDVVLMDPPYDLGEAELLQNLEPLVPRLTADAVLMLERSIRSPEPAWPTGLELDRRKDYGDTTLWWARRAAYP
ncbi:MAG: RsmD family RNA methyltransferase [Lacisediminihabitans sp.]